ncbi:unnamed protein product [Schistosoma mattheei]|uniref:Uncharacterized protein n=1 Tax=Schistosoma mattheei TaxID=31246 RepID=A0A183P8G4_9TREM|nr:unnamed protein product [Schistosoma mattheei]
MENNNQMDIPIIGKTHCIHRNELNTLQINIAYEPNYDLDNTNIENNHDFQKFSGVLNLQCLNIEHVKSLDKKKSSYSMHSNSFNPYDYPYQHHVHCVSQNNDDIDIYTTNNNYNDDNVVGIDFKRSHEIDIVRPPQLPPRKYQRSTNLLIFNMIRSPSDTCLISRKSLDFHESGVHPTITAKNCSYHNDSVNDDDADNNNNDSPDHITQ